jgi:hypothetical protein
MSAKDHEIFVGDSTLHSWQNDVIKEIDSYEVYVGTEAMQTVDDYTQNRNSMIQVSMRKGAGHTFLTAWLAKMYEAAVVYIDHDHLRELDLYNRVEWTTVQGVSAEVGGFHEGSKFVSVFELRHDILLASKSEHIAGCLERLKEKFQNKGVIVIDRASVIMERYREVVDFICQFSQNTPIVLLG